MNGFEDDFVPKGNTFVARRKKARQTMLNLANKLLGTKLDRRNTDCRNQWPL